MTEREAIQLLKQAGQGQKLPPVYQKGWTHDGVTSQGEEWFVAYYQLLKPAFPMPVREYIIFPDRQQRVDFCIVEARIVIEIEGVSHRLTRYESDIRKYNRISAEGWTLLRITAKMLKDDPEGFFQIIASVYAERTREIP